MDQTRGKIWQERAYGTHKWGREGSVHYMVGAGRGLGVRGHRRRVLEQPGLRGRGLLGVLQRSLECGPTRWGWPVPGGFPAVFPQ